MKVNIVYDEKNEHGQSPCAALPLPSAVKLRFTERELISFRGYASSMVSLEAQPPKSGSGIAGEAEASPHWGEAVPQRESGFVSRELH